MAVAQLTRDLSPLFEPRSIAVLGVSADPAKWGHGAARRALLGEHRRSVYLVNRRGGEVLGRPVYRSVTELPEPPDLVLVAVQAAAFEEAVDDALAGGARAIVVLAAGLGETGSDGAARERAVAERVRAAGAVLMGPNCLGIFDARAELEINGLTHGSIGVISQSGNFALELDELAADHGLGFSRFASLGNQADLDVVETLVDFARHEPTRLIAVYCEDFRDGRAFARAAAEATANGKPVLLLEAGRTEAGAVAARSHTGALLSGPRAVDAACAAAGILRVATPSELVDLACALLADVRVPGRRLGILTDGGGSGVVACDLAVAAGLEVPPLGDALSARLKEALAPESPTRNPVDLAASGPKDYFTYERAARLLLKTDEVDAVLLTGYFGGYSRRGADAQRRETEVGHAVGRIADGRLVAQTMYWTSPPAAALREEGVPVYRDIEAATRVLGRLAARTEPRGVPDLPPPATLPARAGYFEARELLAGVDFAPARAVSDLEEARTAARELGYPVVLKALGAVHKSDAGGVVLGIGDDALLVRRFSDVAARLAPAAWSVERMAPLDEGLELVVGARRDPRFGPVALVGLGGLYAELLDDVAVALAPVGEAEAEALVRSLRGAALLTGMRGRPPLDVGAAARALAAVSRVAAEHPEIAELEINPLLVSAAGATGLDARIVLG
jgi:acyl-CoA synthetase (NDP forming)